MTMNRREFGKVTLGGVAIMAIGVEAGCDLASALTEADNIILLLSPLADGVAGIIEIADPPLAPAVMAADKLYDLAIANVETLLAQWAKASAAAQPGILSQALVAVQELNADSASLISSIAQIKGSEAAEIGAITSAITGEISALLTVIPQIGAMGGTTAAANGFAKKAMFGRVNLHGAQSAKSWRGGLVKRMKTPTGLPMDTARTALASKLEALQLK